MESVLVLFHYRNAEVQAQRHQSQWKKRAHQPNQNLGGGKMRKQHFVRLTERDPKTVTLQVFLFLLNMDYQ